MTDEEGFRPKLGVYFERLRMLQKELLAMACDINDPVKIELPKNEDDWWKQ